MSKRLRLKDTTMDKLKGFGIKYIQKDKLNCFIGERQRQTLPSIYNTLQNI